MPKKFCKLSTVRFYHFCKYVAINFMRRIAIKTTAMLPGSLELAEKDAQFFSFLVFFLKSCENVETRCSSLLPEIHCTGILYIQILWQF